MKGNIRHSAYATIACGVLLGFSAMTTAAQANESQPNSAAQLAQLNDTDQASGFQVGRSTQGGPSYVGAGVNIGALGGTSLGDTSLSVISKVGLTNTFSVRPGVVTDFTDDATFLVPVTFDLPATRIGELANQDISVAPYLGGGIAVSTDGDVGPLLTGGLDIPVAEQWTINTAANAGFIDDVDLGVSVGVGYNF
ncbi:hypothetical protein [Acaryochloris sp. IP29b_bin.148]|uniref:hypothetical protein n=1 Tax=Acaryochloris sp. IP29b_bin.148 TaxID=2969218 RepID=UPI002621D9D8|nr:hypothetical protein [Acaryochloris sp. IP29b_bin.148]